VRTEAALVACLAVLFVACHAGEPRGVADGDPIVGSWQVLNLNSSEYVTFQASGTYIDRGSLLPFGSPYAWRRESPEHISVLNRFGPVLDVHAVLTGDLRGLSLVWDTGSAKLVRLDATDGGEPVLPGGGAGGAGGARAAWKDGSSP
jgi:hypothetical protein